MPFKVMAERCDQCLYSPKKIVSNRRRSQIIKDLNRADNFFICHKATMVGYEIACRGDWDQRGCGQIGQIAQRLNVVEFVSETSLPKE